MSRAVLLAASAWLSLLATQALGAGAPFDFALGANAESQACRAQTNFGADRALRQVDLYCGDWDRPSGALTLYPAARKADALAALSAGCPGAVAALPPEGFAGLGQVSCTTAEQGVRRFGLLAERGGLVVEGVAFPADWAPLVRAASVLTGLAKPAAAAVTATPGMREIAAVFPAGPPGQVAAANLELLRRRAFEKNAVWDFGGSQEDFAELLRAHDAVEPDDADGSAEILAEIGLNLSGEGRFDEADTTLSLAETKARQAEDPVLAGKIANYRAIDLMNQEKYQAAIAAALKANAARDHGAARASDGAGVQIPAAEAADDPAAARRRRALIVGLGQMTPQDTAIILSAQGDYIAGAAAAALGEPQADAYLGDALSRLSAISAPPAWLVAEIDEQRARARLTRGDPRGAIAAAGAGLAVIRQSAPRTRTEAHLLLTLGRAERQAGQAEAALASERLAVDIFAAQQIQPGMPVDVASDHLAGLLTAWRASGDRALAAEFFSTSALTWDGTAARSATQLAARLASREASGEARTYQDAERAYRAALARRERLTAANDSTPAQIKEADANVHAAAAALVKAEDDLRARSPRFLELLEPKVSAASVSAALAPDEAYVRILVSRTGSFGVVVTRAGVTPYAIALTTGQAARLAARLHNSNLVKHGRLADYDVAAASDLYQAVFAPAEAALKDIKRLQIDAGGPLAAAPFAALLTAPADKAGIARIRDDQDYRGLPWLGSKVALAQSVGPAPFVRIRAAAAVSGPLTASIFGDFQPAPKLVAERLAAERGLSPHCQEEVEHALSRLQALPDTAQEAQKTAALFSGAARVSLGADFTDQRFLADKDVTQASVIMLATHGVLGLSSCFAEPALLASLGQTGDGLIEASELLDRQLHAKLVVLSACDTAGGGRADTALTGLSDGGEALSGLARAFLYAGASSVMATQWKVDETASGAEIQSFFRYALKEGLPLSDALGKAQARLYGDAETSHPFYWAAFSIIGDGAVTLASPPAPKPAKVAIR